MDTLPIFEEVRDSSLDRAVFRLQLSSRRTAFSTHILGLQGDVACTFSTPFPVVGSPIAQSRSSCLDS
jgi:hypothetical protein